MYYCVNMQQNTHAKAKVDEILQLAMYNTALTNKTQSSERKDNHCSTIGVGNNFLVSKHGHTALITVSCNKRMGYDMTLDVRSINTDNCTRNGRKCTRVHLFVTIV